jgi:hypothetical protein
VYDASVNPKSTQNQQTVSIRELASAFCFRFLDSLLLASPRHPCARNSPGTCHWESNTSSY